MSSAGSLRLSGAVEQYLTARRSRYAPSTVRADADVTRRLVAEVGDLLVRNLTADHVEAFFINIRTEHCTRDGRTRQPVSAASFNYYYSRIKQLMTYMRARGWLRHDVMAHVHPMKREHRLRQQPTADVMWRMLDATPDRRDRALLATACNTGLRASEIAALRVGDVNLERLSLRVRISKSSTEDDMPITSDLDTELTSWLDYYAQRCLDDLDRLLQPSDYLFPARRGPLFRWRTLPDGTREQFQDPSNLDPLRPVQKLHRIAQQALWRVGLPTTHEGIHTIRRGVARAYFDRLVSEDGYDGALRVVSAFLHHSNVSTTETYLGLSSERKKRDETLRGRSLLGPRPSEQRHADIVRLR